MSASEPSPRRSFVTRWLDRLGVDTRDLVSGAAIAFVVKLVGAGASFVLSLVIAKWLGAEGAGDFFLCVGVLVVVSALGRLGLDQAVIRFVAADASDGKWGRIRSLARTSIMWASGLLIACALFLAFGSHTLANVAFGRDALAPLLRVTAWGVVPMGVSWIYAGLLRGRRDIAGSQLVQAVLNQLLTLPLLWALYTVGHLTVELALYAYAIATGGGLVVGALWWHLRLPPVQVRPFPPRALLATSLPLYGVTLMNVLAHWLPVLLVGALATSAETGIFVIAMRVVRLAGFVLLAINVMAAPQFAALFHQRRGPELARLVRQTSLLTTIVGVPALAAVWLFPGGVLSLFGEPFVAGAPVLRILAVGYAINLVTGSVGTLLVMSGRERAMQSVTLLSTGVLAVGCISLIPMLGVVGAAIAASGAMVLQNALAAWWAWHAFRINPVFFLPSPATRLPG
ncbi:MAG: oligosaccharide flippase family protein [Bacteroidota bacterium]